MNNSLTDSSVKQALRLLASEQRAASSRRFFKLGKGQYGEGDEFIGVSVPDQRRLLKDFRGMSLNEIQKLLKSKVHEDRHMALLLMVDSYGRQKSLPEQQDKVVAAYLKHLKYVNNWDLVDVSAPKLLGNWLLTRNRDILYTFADSPRLWTRRVAMVATWELIRHGEADDALALSAKLLDDPEDLMHKAAGWMLREVGQRVGLAPLRLFLRQHAAQMPRTMLRYATEKLPEAERRRWLK